MVVLIVFTLVLLAVNIAAVFKHRNTVFEMRRRHIMSLHNVDGAVRHYVDEKTARRIQVHINDEVNRA